MKNILETTNHIQSFIYINTNLIIYKFYFMPYLQRLLDQLTINVLGYHYSYQSEHIDQGNLVILEPENRHPSKIKYEAIAKIIIYIK